MARKPKLVEIETTEPLGTYKVKVLCTTEYVIAIKSKIPLNHLNSGSIWELIDEQCPRWWGSKEVKKTECEPYITETSHNA